MYLCLLRFNNIYNFGNIVCLSGNIYCLDVDAYFPDYCRYL
jgi:hypothetical protein